MNRGKNSCAGHGKQRHGFGEPVDRIAPRLPQQQQDGGDERARVADTDPPHEVDNGEAPADRDGVSPDPDALQKQVADGVEHHHREHEGDAEAEEPAVRRGTGQHDGADFFRDRGEGVARLDDRSSFDLRLSSCMAQFIDSSPTPALRCEVLSPTLSTPGSDCQLPPDTWSAGEYSVRPARL